MGSPRHLTISGIQKAAVLELLQDATAAKAITGEDIARISDAIMSVPWAQGHEHELLQAMSNKALPKRRKQQDFSAASAYLNHSRWNRFTSPNCDLNSKADFFANFTACEIDCLNPTEPTYRHWTSEILVAHFDKETCTHLGKESKYALMEHLKKEHKKNVKNRSAAPALYLLKLPSDPRDHRDQHGPELFNRLFPNGEEPVGSRLDATLVMAMDASFQCRGGWASSKEIAKVTPAAPPALNAADLLASCLPQLMQGLASYMTTGSGSFNPPGFQRGRGAKRSFRALEDGPSFRALEDGPLEDDPSFSAPQVEDGPRPPVRPSSAPGGPLKLPPRRGAAHSAPLKLEGFEAESDEEAQAEDQASMPAEDKASKPAEDQALRPSAGDAMLDAILKRDSATRKEAAEKAAEKKRAAAAAKVAEKAAEREKAESPAGEAVPPPKKASPRLFQKTALPVKAAGDAAGAAGHAALPVKAAGDAAGAAGHAGKKSTMSHERSRSQYLCRTGVKGEASVKFRYKMQNGDDAEYASEKAAFAAAKNWLKGRTN